MSTSLIRSAFIASVALLAHTAPMSSALAAPVLMVSIDGMRPDDVLDAEQHGLSLPTLHGLADNGAVATSVRNVLPTITYPNHTTLITGVFPSRHGVVSNTTFDPLGKNMGGWMWYAEDIKVPTLWDTVKAHGGKVASVGWPVSVGARSIDFNIPEFWRARTSEDEKLVRAVSTPGLPEAIERATGVPFSRVALEGEDRDDALMAWVPAIMATCKPRLFTVHLVTLDEARHKFGPYSPEARATLERIDRDLKPMIEKARAAMPGLVVAIVSDHGFGPVEKGLNLEAAFVADGLVTLDTKGKVADWSAMPWITGGSAAIMLKDPTDKSVEERVRTLLDKLAADPANGINKIMDRAAIAHFGGNPAASFWVDLKAGFIPTLSASKDLLVDVSYKGMHGYAPDNAAMSSSFILSGPGIAHEKLGVIDMRDIAPTIGHILEAPLPSADGHVLPVMTVGK